MTIWGSFFSVVEVFNIESSKTNPSSAPGWIWQATVLAVKAQLESPGPLAQIVPQNHGAVQAGICVMLNKMYHLEVYSSLKKLNKFYKIIGDD